MAEQIEFKFALSDAELTRIGQKAIQIITERTLRGIDADGKPFARYSTKPLAIPAGSLTGKARTALKEQLHFFKSKRGALWVIINGGYAAFKAATNPQDGGTVNLWRRGTMMQNLTVVGVDSSTNTVRIGFANPAAAEIASYHNVLGAGKSKVIRRFMGLAPAERDELSAYAGARIVVVT